jgi:SAM-dependent methyltransferase
MATYLGYHQQMRMAWTANDTVTAWTRCHHQWSACSAEMTRALLEVARPHPGERVLDLAAGTGMTAFALADAVRPDGQVLATDLSPGLVSAARQIGESAGYRDISYREADAHRLPFDNASFDLVTSKLGVMFFADASLAHGEIRRVLRPGGRVAHLVWGPPTQAFFRATVGVLAAAVALPAPQPDVPNLFRYSRAGSLATVLIGAGLMYVEERHYDILLRWPGDATSLAAWWLEVVAGPWRPLFEALPHSRRQSVATQITEALVPYQHGACTSVPAEIIIGIGTAPLS